MSDRTRRRFVMDEAAGMLSRTPAALGAVTLRQLIATWVAHDLDHLTQIARVLGRQYSEEVGPWRAYLRVISGTQG